MQKTRRLTKSFFSRSVHEVAPDLIGATLLFRGVGGPIVEVEAYHHTDPAAHSYNGKTERNAVMFGPPGYAYVYRSYGIHWCVNFVCEAEGSASAVLIRALAPTARPRDHAAPPRRAGRTAAVLRTGACLPGARRHASAQRIAARCATVRASGRSGAGRDRVGPSHRDHEGGRPSMAVRACWVSPFEPPVSLRPACSKAPDFRNFTVTKP